MFITLLIPSNLAPIMVWKELSPLLFLRACVWLLGLSILPGLYALRVTRIVEHLPDIGKITIGINLSLVLVGLTTLITYYVEGNIISLPWIILSILVILGCTHWLKSKVNLSTLRLKLSKWNLLLITVIVATIFIAFSVQLAQRYLIPGDVWVSLNPSVQVISQRNVYEAFGGQYPIMFGFVLAGLSACSGLPIVNTYVLLFPLVALNILSFFVMVKVVFNMDDKVGVIASIIYGFGGGLAWLIQIIVYHGEKSFRSLSYLSQDMYDAMPFWNDIQFSHKSLALTLAYASLVAFALTGKFRDVPRKMVTLMLSFLLMLFSFFIHMLEPLVLAPLILAMAYVNQKGLSRYLSLGFFALITILIAYPIDFLMHGWYSWLTSEKIQMFFSIINIDKLLVYSLLALGGISIIILNRRFLYRQTASRYAHKSHLKSIKRLLIASLIGIYLSGLYFFTVPSSLELSSSFPWYLYVTRYGFVGLLALVGVGVAKWKEKWFILASFWIFFVLVTGSLWWGSRINSYLFPMMALLAAVGINGIWRGANTFLHISVTTASNSVTKSFKLNLKPVTVTLIIIVLALSFTSVIYGASYYNSMGPCISDDLARAFSWIHQNIPENVTVLVPYNYRIRKGINTISDRDIYDSAKIPTIIDAVSFINLTETLSAHNIRYGMSIEDGGKTSPVGLLSYSTIVFQSGNVKVLRFPALSPPSSKEYAVAVVDRELLGFWGDAHDFGWIDDSFIDGWSYSNVNAESDGEVLTFKWEFCTGDKLEPSMKKNFSPIDTNAYPYVVVRYRNTAETSVTAENNVGQIITLVNETGYPKGFVKNFYLPICKDGTFCVFTDRLPANQSIAEVWIWMRNYKDLNGTIDLQIDYLGFASSEAVSEPADQIRFLSMALPALWPTEYSIFSNFDEAGNASFLVSRYDESVFDYVKDISHTHTFVFLNLTASFPSWGEGWKNVEQGVISGHLEGKRILIVGIKAILLNDGEDLSRLAKTIFEEISTYSLR